MAAIPNSKQVRQSAYGASVQKLRLATINTNYTGGGAATVARTVFQQVVQSQEFSTKFFFSYGAEGPQDHVERLGTPSRKVVATLSYRLLSNADFLLRANTRQFHEIAKSFDLLHLHNLHGYYLNEMQFLDQLRRPFVWTLHDSWLLTGRCTLAFNCDHWRTANCERCPDLGQSPRTWWLDRAKEDFQVKRQVIDDLMKRNNGILVTPSRWLRERVLQIGIDPGLVRVIHNPVDTDLFRPATDKQSLRRELNLPIDKTLIMFSAARLSDPLKGARYMQQLQKHFQNYAGKHFVCVGEPPAQMRLANTSLMGYISSTQNLARIYAACDLFVSTSLSENFPLCVIEAMSTGTPVVAFDVGGIPEQVCNASGILVSSGDLRALVRAVEALTTIDNIRTLQQMGYAAREKCERSFNRQKIVQQYLDLYKEVSTTDAARRAAA